MSEARKGKKQNPFQGRLEAQLKSKSASLPTSLDYGGAGNAVKGRDERQLRAPLTAFPAPVPPSVLTTAVVVIHGMTSSLGDTERVDTIIGNASVGTQTLPFLALSSRRIVC